MVGDELKLTCEVNKVTTDIKWMKNGPLESPRVRISPRQGDKIILSIEKVVESDSGKYFCEASNEAGIVSRTSVEIKVKGKENVLIFGQMLPFSGEISSVPLR